MRTKQLRISDVLQIKNRMPEFVGKKINIVLSDSTAMFGELKKVNDTEITLMNMRLEKINYPFEFYHRNLPGHYRIMLQHLTIRNYALIKQLEMDPSSNLNVITGETGAGKSIMLGAIGLLMGNRADTKVLWDESEKCVTEGTFSIEDTQLKTIFVEEDLGLRQDHRDCAGRLVPVENPEPLSMIHPLRWK